MNSLLPFTVLSSFIASVFGHCPSKYSEMTPDHSYCLSPNPNCDFISKGIEDQAEIDIILDVHNSYRSKIAMGMEHRAGGMPPAANMRELSWDKELADIAQKWAEQCHFDHDCNDCRSTPAYWVGQNIAESQVICNRLVCGGRKKPDWQGMIRLYYDEVADFHNYQVSQGITSPYTPDGKKIGHFTAMIWAQTYKIGCGYVTYREGNSEKQYYVCNYAPAGNTVRAPVYSIGSPCSQCPEGTCCGPTCKGGRVYPGLCSATTVVRPLALPTFLLLYFLVKLLQQR